MIKERKKGNRTQTYHHGLGDVRLDVENGTELEQDVHQGCVARSSGLADERDKSNCCFVSFDIKRVLFVQLLGPRLERGPDLEANRQTVERTLELASLCKVLVQFFGTGNCLVKECLSQTLCLQRISETQFW